MKAADTHASLASAASPVRTSGGAVEVLFVELRRALADGRVAESALRLDRLSRVLEIHFSLEDRIYFPALHALVPSLADDLRRLGREHEAMLEALAAMRRDLDEDRSEWLVADIDELASLFAEHEAREDAILVAFERGD